MLTDCRLIIDSPAGGPWNMAVDETLLEQAAEQGRCAWRFYRWSQPTLSLGYFQAYDERWQHAASGQCPVVRRASGGGAIVHDRELTYSVALPEGHPLAIRRMDLYEAVHRTLIECLARLGADAALWPEGSDRLGHQPFLCFQRRAAGDVLVGPFKVAGSAQRRCRGAVLQHGSVLLGTSLAAPELPGLHEMLPNRDIDCTLTEDWTERLGRQFGFLWHRAGLSDDERARAVSLAEGKYAAETWTVHRGRRPREPNSADSARPHNRPSA